MTWALHVAQYVFFFLRLMYIFVILCHAVYYMMLENKLSEYFYKIIEFRVVVLIY
jgi:hypothetical protein